MLIGWFWILWLAGQSFRPSSAYSCLKGWDLAVAMRETHLNTALDKVVARFLQHHTLPAFQHHEDNSGGSSFFMRNTVSFTGLRVSSLRLAAVSTQQQEGRLAVTFSAGSLAVTREVVLPTGQTMPLANRTLAMSWHTVNFRARVTAYRAKLEHSTGDRYSLKLEIVGEDAIIGTLGWSIEEEAMRAVRTALTEKMKRELRLGKQFNLGTFDLPLRDQRQTSLAKDLFPKTIRFSFTFAPHGQSVVAGLASTGTETQIGAFSWGVNELIPEGKSSAITVSGAKLMQSLKPVIASQLSLGSSAVSSSSTCPASIGLIYRINDFRGNTDLKDLTMRMHGRNELEMDLRMFDHVSPGISVDIHVRVRLQLTFDNNAMRFDVRKSYQHHSTDYHREWWVVLLEVISFGIGRLITEIITAIADGHIAGGLRAALDFDPRKGGMPINIGGVLGEVFDHMSVDFVHFYKNNLVFPFTIRW